MAFQGIMQLESCWFLKCNLTQPKINSGRRPIVSPLTHPGALAARLLSDRDRIMCDLLWSVHSGSPCG